MNGILVLDKPEGITSAMAVNKVKKLLGDIKAGHTGTLDPFATGVLPICLNKATKIIPYLNEKYKVYKAIMILGITTDTLDCTGKILSQTKLQNISLSDIKSTISDFIGVQEQVPPMYSAVKVGGVRLYELARKGKNISRNPKQVDIKSIGIVNCELPEVELIIKCSRGTYIRTLCSDIGDKLGYGAHLKSLERLSSGRFVIEDSCSIDDIESGNYKLISIAEALSDHLTIDVDKSLAEKIMIGVQITKKIINKIKLPKFKKEDIITIRFDKKVISICKALIDCKQFEYAEDEDIIFRHLKVFN